MSQAKLQHQSNSRTSFDSETFGEWHAEYHGRLLNSMTTFVRDRDVAEDVTSMALAIALENLHNFRRESSFYTWVHTIALNEARRDARRSSRTVSLETITSGEPGELQRPELLVDALEVSQYSAILKRALSQIPSIHRKVLVDHFILGYPIKQIARRDRLAIGTVLSRIFAAKETLRQAWKRVSGTKAAELPARMAP